MYLCLSLLICKMGVMRQVFIDQGKHGYNVLFMETDAKSSLWQDQDLLFPLQNMLYSANHTFTLALRLCPLHFQGI